MAHKNAWYVFHDLGPFDQFCQNRRRNLIVHSLYIYTINLQAKVGKLEIASLCIATIL